MSHEPVENEIALKLCGLLPAVLVSNTYCFVLAVFADSNTFSILSISTPSAAQLSEASTTGFSNNP